MQSFPLHKNIADPARLSGKVMHLLVTLAHACGHQVKEKVSDGLLTTHLAASGDWISAHRLDV